MVGQPERRLLDGVEEAGEARVVHLVVLGDEDELVVDRNAVLFRVEGDARPVLDVELVQLEIAERADHRIDRASHQGLRKREVDVDELHVVEGEAPPA